MRYGFDRVAGRLRLIDPRLVASKKSYNVPEVKRTTIVIPTKESSEYFISGQVNIRKPEVKPTYLPVWIIIAFLSLGAVYRYKTTKAREDAFQAKKLKEEEEKRQKDKAAKAS